MSTDPLVIIHPGQRCTDLNGNSVLESMTHGVRTWGNDPNGSTVFIVGAYEYLSDISDRLLRALPPALSLTNSDGESPIVQLLCDSAGSVLRNTEMATFQHRGHSANRP